MPKTVTRYFTHSHTVLENGSLSFECSQDVGEWPWLALPPHDPIVVQSINYWAPVEIGATRGTFDRTKWTALTKTEWICGEPGTGHAVRGSAEPIEEDNSMGYDIKFYDEKDALVYTMQGTGVVFQNRDFESWRDHAKEKIAALPKVVDFQYAPHELVGAENQKGCFISPLSKGKTIAAQGFITQDNGFIPAHPHISGSGDHVNSTHLAVVGMQFVCLLNDGRELYCTGGSMAFKRFVELGYPFDIKLITDRRNENVMEIAMYQAGTLCAEMTINYNLRGCPR